MSAIILLVAQLLATRIQNPNSLWTISGLTGLGYGALFGVYPALVVDSFGVHGFSLNWGFIMFSSVISGNILNILYGATYDHHSTILPGGDRDCPDGIKCYVLAYWITLALSAIAILLSLWCIKDDHARARQLQEADDEDRP
jgi:MFS family permease